MKSNFSITVTVFKRATVTEKVLNYEVRPLETIKAMTRILLWKMNIQPQDVKSAELQSYVALNLKVIPQESTVEVIPEGANLQFLVRMKTE